MTQTKLEAVLGDITTQQDVEAIVNAANPTLLGGGVDGAIHRAAGPALLEECRALGGCPTGEARITRGYSLPAAWILHTPGPRWRGGDHQEQVLLASSYRSCLRLAAAHSISTIAFPSISTGIYHFPLREAARIAVKTVADFLEDHPDQFSLVRFVLFDEKTRHVYESEILALDQNGSWMAK